MLQFYPLTMSMAEYSIQSEVARIIFAAFSVITLVGFFVLELDKSYVAPLVLAAFGICSIQLVFFFYAKNKINNNCKYFKIYYFIEIIAFSFFFATILFGFVSDGLALALRNLLGGLAIGLFLVLPIVSKKFHTTSFQNIIKPGLFLAFIGTFIFGTMVTSSCIALAFTGLVFNIYYRLIHLARVRRGGLKNGPDDFV